MEWLRSVDLAEYAPNLRGSGVHGGLMVRQFSVRSSRETEILLKVSSPKRLLCLQVLEPRFNVETMALLLNIPPNKTLLRRHLATHFNLLIGSESQQHKQECLENPDYILLTATTKVKVTHKLLRINCRRLLKVLLVLLITGVPRVMNIKENIFYMFFFMGCFWKSKISILDFCIMILHITF